MLLPVLALLALSSDLLGLAGASESLPERWEPRAVRGFTLPAARIVQNDGLRAVQVAGATAAGWWLARLEAPFETGHLSWEWRVLEQPSGADLREASRDDSALRIFLVFGPADVSETATRAIFYTWGHAEPRGFRSQGHRTDRFHVIRLAGSADVGPRWLEEEVDPFHDYSRIWGEPAPPVSAIGFMQDTDQTGRHAVAELRELRLKAATPR